MVCVLLKDEKIHQLFRSQADCDTYVILNPAPGYRSFMANVFYYDPVGGDFKCGFSK